MDIFIDESGNLGFDFNKSGTSQYFVITALLCRNGLVQNSMRHAINKTIKNKINRVHRKRLITELKGSVTPISIKQYFYNHLSLDDNWGLYSVIINKKTFKKPRYIKNSALLYNLFTGYLLNELHTELNTNTIITIDKCKTNKEIVGFNRDIESIFYTMTNGKYNLIINHETSHNNKILQAVDVFCNGIYKKYEENNIEWYRKFGVVQFMVV